ncbi:MAG: methionine synthase [Dysgonamonadaceae bacterium]|jgi:5-methyltetrahydrofolate--homocysteine methyltransferase|nr:methionine synthase [Dysgonamonadaceae bacterium]
MTTLNEILHNRILVLDGAMGTMVQKYGLTENDFRGTEFVGIKGQLQGNNDALCITRPDVIGEIHTKYLQAGADIITTCSFGSNRISQADYGMERYVRELNLAAARLARKTADEFTRKNPDKPRFVAGTISPTNKAASISPDVANPAYRAVGFDELREVYREQIDALIEGGINVLLFETCFDTLNLKAGLFAAQEAFAASGKEIPVMVSFTIGDKSGRILSGQTIGAAVASIAHVKLLSVGLNCSFGAKDVKPYLKELSEIAPCYLSAHPNAGLPNSLGCYDETPASMASQIREYLEEKLVNIIGGCCGTTPEHIAAIAETVAQTSGNSGHRRLLHQDETSTLTLSGLETLTLDANHPQFTLIGERCNVAGSRKFLRLIKEKQYEKALETARHQAEDGADILDLNVDDGLLDGVAEMTNFLNLMGSEPDIARLPVMLDSSDWDILEAGLKCVQGKSIVNSISLKNGEADFIGKARRIRAYGAAVIAMAFDERGQADTYGRKIEICGRMYRLLTEEAGFRPSDIIFDPNILAIATGIEEHSNYAVDFIRTVSWIKENLRGSKVSGGVSNLSFAFRGNDRIREAMHVVFLHHAARAGMDMGIVNPSSRLRYEDIPQDFLVLLEDVIFNRRTDSAERLLDYARLSGEGGGAVDATTVVRSSQWRGYSLAERLRHAIIKGISEYMEEDLSEALKVYSPLEIIDGPLMGGLNVVGDLFGEGKMFLPQVVKSARTMKHAVAFLQPYIESGDKGNAKSGRILMATVKGDVHDIGKNIVSVVLSCNNYEVIDIGVMVPAERIVEEAIDNKVDAIGLSGLITPSLHEMSVVARRMEHCGLKIPLLIGGATTSGLHTALKIAPLYGGTVVRISDASRAVPVVGALLNCATKDSYSEQVREEQRLLREGPAESRPLVSLSYAREHALRIDFSGYTPPRPMFTGSRVIEYISVSELVPYIEWSFLLTAWKFPARSESPEALELLSDARRMLSGWSSDKRVRAVIGFYPACRDGDSLRLSLNSGAVCTVPFLRQQERRDDDVYKSLADFISPLGDYVGLFAVTAGNADGSCFRHDRDDYLSLLGQTLLDRLAEAAAEYLHERVRRYYWGYSPDEMPLSAEGGKRRYRGIRPASGYPSCPDLSLNFFLDEVLDLGKIGIGFTLNGAINPPASVAGFYFAHPDAKYFMVGSIDSEQLADYADRKGISKEDAGKWLGIG